MIGEIQSLGLEREMYAEFFISDMNKTKQNKTCPQTFTYSLAPEEADQLRPESQNRNIWPRCGMGLQREAGKTFLKEPLTHTPSLIFSSSGAAAAAGGLGRTDVFWGGGHGAQGPSAVCLEGPEPKATGWGEG